MRIGAAVWLIAVFGAATPLAAQGSGVELGVGYQFLRLGGAWFPQGFSVGVVKGLTGEFAVVGETGWSRDSTTSFGFRQRTTALHLAGGVRWNPVGDHRFRPFAQIVIGAERDRTSVKEFGSDSASSLLVQPGGGINVRLNNRQRVFGQVDLRRVFQEGAALNVIRTVFGWQVAIL
jgi:hypothetical protein